MNYTRDRDQNQELSCISDKNIQTEVRLSPIGYDESQLLNINRTIYYTSFAIATTSAAATTLQLVCVHHG